VREYLLEHWEHTDGFVFGHTHEDDANDAQSVAQQLWALLGPRVVTVNLTSAVAPSVVERAASWAEDWHPHGHPLEQYASRTECFDAVRRAEAVRGAEYAVFVRIRLDMQLFQPVPVAFLQAVVARQAEGGACAVFVPTGEDFGNVLINDLVDEARMTQIREEQPDLATWQGINDRMLVGTRCGMQADASIIEFMASVAPNQTTQNWNCEMAQLANLQSHNLTILRQPMANVLVLANGSLHPSSMSSLAITDSIIPNFVARNYGLCGELLLAAADDDCTTNRQELPGGSRVVQDPGSFHTDPGFCQLQRQCVAAQPPLAIVAQGGRPGQHIEFMYEPVGRTIERGLRSSGFEVELITEAVTEMFDEDQDLYVSVSGTWPSRDSANIWGGRQLPRQVKRGDILVWIGEVGLPSVDWAALRDLGLYLIYYQSEPRDHCQLNSTTVDEMWDFSAANVRNCAGAPDAPRMRYIPLAWRDEAPQLPEKTLALKRDLPTRLVFYGGITHGRQQCWEALGRLPMKNRPGYMRDYINATYNVWDNDRFTALLNETSVFRIWLNLHKDCDPSSDAIHPAGGNPVPVTWRNPILLNSGGLILSQRCDHDDEHEFRGLLTFADHSMEGIRDGFEQLSALPASQRVRMAVQREKAFHDRFDAADIFRRANVTRELAWGVPS